MKKIKVLSLFSGCGGFDYGFKKAGFDIVFANDIEPKLKETYEKNLKHQISIQNICEIDKKTLPQAEVILAGIPCQPFSNAGNRKSTEDKDGNLFLQVIETIKHQKKKPSVVIFENVRGFLSSKDEKGMLLIDRFYIEMSKLGFNTKHQLLNSADFGLPSNRFRVFIVCINKSIKKEYYFPVPELFKRYKNTIGDILSKPYPKGESQEVWNLPPSSMKIVKYILEGGSWKNIPTKHLPERFIKIRNDMKKYHSPNFYRRFSRTEIMGTVTATSSPENSGILHPLENRRYSVREIARFQTFPDAFKFYGNDISYKYKMIGNAVQPAMAEIIAKSLLSQIF